MKKVIAIVGPTAVGKTKLSIELAKALNGEIINGDALQIYKGLDIGTAKITPTEMEGIVHHLLDEKQPHENYSVAEFQKKVREKIDAITSRGKLPIIVGGTGLYIKAVLYDYDFTEERAAERSNYDHLTNEQVHHILAEIDPLSAKELHPNNRRRVIRAIEIFHETKRTKSDALQAQQKKMLYDACIIGLTDDREKLYGRINKRVDQMVDKGLLQEVTRLKEAGITKEMQAMSAIGYKEIYDYLSGVTDLETALELVKRNSRRLAKRQFTWFRNQLPTQWLEVSVDDFQVTIDGSLILVENFWQ